MRYGLKVAITAILLLSVPIGCSKGPGKGQDFDGTYAGQLSGNPNGYITFTMSGSSITGEGEIEASYSWRPIGDPPHFTFTGTRSGREVTIGAPLALEFNSAGFGEDPIWIEVTTTLTLTGSINDSGAISGSFGGPNPQNEDRPFHGSWSAMKTGSASGLTRSF